VVYTASGTPSDSGRPVHSRRGGHKVQGPQPRGQQRARRCEYAVQLRDGDVAFGERGRRARPSPRSRAAAAHLDVMPRRARCTTSCTMTNDTRSGVRPGGEDLRDPHDGRATLHALEALRVDPAQPALAETALTVPGRAGVDATVPGHKPAIRGSNERRSSPADATANVVAPCGFCSCTRRTGSRAARTRSFAPRRSCYGGLVTR
jgi:hypothetical protein